ncbi:uncharacterized protein MONBRDRAFT_23509 [Monosiga brevicollis MX1]|uniref:XPA C-terminal domain-containing protein n=1 Tax=Monosiga brevicollis TaxID=81824 RepID=A9UTM2_MONBE|nr:uncharacterized protein MONBRDRAFT_23509 [Monosiga brevicollis MX1]EDQ91270.1 predicted protein [Monosiga brevicollis MX1]|eukprot:XP_001743692.1 hypothetical protein [Monosiga brevicollis MX1]
MISRCAVPVMPVYQTLHHLTRSDAASSTPVVRRSTGFFRDTQAGFLLEEPPNEPVDVNPKRAKRHEHTPGAETMPSYPRGPACIDCGQEFTESFLVKHFGVVACNACRDVYKAGKYRLVTKTTASKEYLLRDSELSGGQSSLRFIERDNPNNDTYNKMKLFLLSQVQERSYARYEDEFGLQAEHDRRAAVQQGHQDRRREERLKKLRKETLTSEWLAQRVVHEHTFNPEDEVYDEEEDQWTKTCADCGFKVTYERM